MKNILDEARQLQSELVRWRRDLHRHPELGFQERRTAQLVTAHLRQLGLKVEAPVAATGVLGLLIGARPGPTLALRADMDALPIQEANSCDYASAISGVMHACGHDGHTAILMGAAQLLAHHREKLHGQVKFLFQPAEEGPGGAAPMIAQGVLEEPRVDAVLGLHLHTDLPTGQVAIKPGVASTHAAGFELFIAGRGGHGAMPHRAVDPIVAAAAVIQAVQGIVSRQVNPLQLAVISIGTITGGFRSNVIAPAVTMQGTVRSLERETLLDLTERLQRTTSAVALAYGCEAKVTIELGYPAVVNDPDLCLRVEDAAGRLLGAGNVQRLAAPMLGSEDFAFFGQERPSCFFGLGACNEALGFTQAWHHPQFDFDEEALPIGVAVLCQTVFDYFQAKA